MGEARIDYWMRQIRAMSGNSNRAPIFLVGTHIDDPICTAEHLERLTTTLSATYHKYCFCGLRTIAFVSCRTGQGVLALKERLHAVLTDKKLFSTVVPDSWVNLHNTIRRRGEPQVDWATYRQWAMQCSIVDQQALKLATEFLADVGTIVYFADESIDLVVLKPQWLADIMASLITFRHGWIKEGLLPDNFLRMVFESYPESLHETLLALLKRFEVVYRVQFDESVNYLVPTKLPLELPPEVLLAKWPVRVPPNHCEYGRVFTFPFLPLGFFGRVLVRVLHIPGVTPRVLWRNGCVVADRLQKEQALLEFTDACTFVVRVRTPIDAGRRRRQQLFLLSLLDAVNTLIDSHYNIEYDVGRFVPCTHCLDKGEPPSQAFLFTYKECADAAMAGTPFVFCKHIRSANRTVVLARLAPDLAFSNIPLIDDSQLTLEQVIGRGGFGIVHKGELRLRDGSTVTVAVKEMYFRRGTVASRRSMGGGSSHNSLGDSSAASSAPRSEEDIQHEQQFLEFQKEVFIMRYAWLASLACLLALRCARSLTCEASGLRHPNLVRLYGVSIGPLRMVLEYAPREDLFKLLHPNSDAHRATCIAADDFPWRLRLLIALDLARGMRHLQRVTPPILHRDLRSPNVFVR